MSDKDKVFPIITESHYWSLRDKFRSALPRSKVDANYVASLLGRMTSKSAQANVVRPIKLMGIIDDNGSVTDLGVRWRNDDQYADACKEILESVYPSQLLDLQPPPNPDRSGVSNWLLNATRAGASAASRQSSTYVLLANANLTRRNESNKSKEPTPRRPRESTAGIPRATPRVKKNSTSNERGVETQTPEEREAAPAENSTTRAIESGPSMHIDLQIHINPEMSSEQIDKIFESMGRHLYGRKANDR